MKKVLSLFALLALTCSMYATEVTVTKTVQTLKDELGWSAGGTTYPDFDFSEAISVDSKATNNGAVYSGTPIYWRCYQTRENGEFTIKANDGCIIKSIKIAYSRKNNGTLAWKSGSSLGDDNRVVQNTLYEINNQSITIYTGSTGTNTDGQVNITQFTITYDDPNVIYETFSQVVQTTSAVDGTTWQGDLAEWTVSKVRRNDDKMVDNTPATWTSAGAYMKMTAEGGIKHICFNWSQMGSKTTGTTITMGISVGSEFSDSKDLTTVATASALVQTYDKEVACKENALLTLSNASVSSGNDRVEFGNIIITPYLFFNVPNHKDTLDFATAQSYDLGAVLINNTGENPTYEILSNSTGSACEITNGVMDLSDVISEGDIQVKASWNEGKVYTTMNLHVKYNPTPEAGKYFEETFAAMTISSKYGSQSVVGDSAVYGTWNFVASKRQDSDVASKEFRLNSKNAAAVSSADVLEGGIKDVYFTWRIAAGASAPVNLAFSMESIGEDTVTAEMTNMPKDATETHPSVVHLNVKKNAQFKLEILTSKTSQVSLYSPLKIVPYLLFTVPNHKVTLNYPTEKTYDLNAVLINNTGEPANYEVKENTLGGAGVINNGVLDLSDIKYSGYITVKASWNEGKVYTTLTIYVGNTSVTLADANVTINDTYTPTPTGKQGSTVIDSPTFTYESSNSSVAVVNGQTISLVGAGSTTITTTMASGADYLGAKTTSTLTVTAVAPTEGAFWRETFKNMATGTAYNTVNVNIVGDSGVYVWNCREFQHHADNDKVAGELGVRIRPAKDYDNYIEMDGNQEGGIKEVYVKWRLPGSGSPDVLFNVEGYDENNLLVQRIIDMKDVTAGSANVIECQQKMDIKQNAKLKIFTQTGSSAVVFGPISVTPYLLFNNKFIEKKITECTAPFKNESLINNIEGGTLTFISSNENVATVTNEGNVTVLAASDDTITITAKWVPEGAATEVTTTYRLKINDKEKREASFAKDTVSLKVGEVPENTLSGNDIENATITYSSADEHVAKIENNMVKVVGIGTTIITADVAEDDTYLSDQASYALVVTAKEAQENILVEAFTGIVSEEGVTLWEGDLKKYGITWTRSDLVQRRTDDKIAGKQGTWMMQGKYITSNEIIEGGVKHFYARWIQPAKEPESTLQVGLYLDDETKAVPATGDSIYNLGGVSTGKIYTYAANPDCKRNAKLTFKNISNNPSNPDGGRIIFDQFNIVPYLFYTLKADTIKAADYPSGVTYKNENLINNTDGVGSISYSVLGENASSIASVDDEGKVSIISDGLVTIQAKWNDVTTTYTLLILGNQYQLTWNADGGTLSGGTEAGLVTVGTALEAPTATKVGYNHVGWNPEVPAVMPDSDVTYTATYTAKQCNITLKSNYEGGAEDIEFVATYGEASPKTSTTELFTRPGYSIVRGFWKDSITEAGGTRLVNAKGAFTQGVKNYTDNDQKWIRNAEEDITLYAHWKLDTFKITYANMEGATNFEDAPTKYTVETPTITLGTPTKTGYTFNGWKKTDAEGEAITEIAKGSIGKITLWATWTVKKCTITLKCNYTDGPKDVVFEATYGEESPLTASDVHTRENYTMYRGYWMDSVSEGKGTRLVNPTGKFTTDVNGYTTGQVWTRDTVENITLYAHWELATLVLNEGADNSAMLSEADGKTVDVTLTRSPLVPNVWNSLCLPFAIDKTELGVDSIVELTGASLSGDAITVVFTKYGENTLVAGTPYLVRPTDTVKLTSFASREIDATPKTIGDNELIELVGIYSPMALTANDKTKLFLAKPDAKGNNLFFASVDGSLKGMRAYFNLLEQTSGAPIRMGRMVIATPTGMVDVNENANENQKMIIDGKLVIVRNGVYYDVNGQIVK